jgi:hypothetical protein
VKGGEKVSNDELQKIFIALRNGDKIAFEEI